MNVRNNSKIVYDNIIKIHLSTFLGIEKDDISDDDILKDDLHMSVSDLTDFVHTLKNNGLNITISNISDIETVRDLIEIISENEEF